jgi:hypothetical protein
MLLHLKQRIGTIIFIIGGLIAIFGEVFNLWHNDPTDSGWFVSMGAVVLGTMILLYGMNTYVQLSDRIDFLGVVGAGLLFLGGLFTIMGTLSIDMIVVPLLLAIANTIANAVNSLGNLAQNATNSTTSGLNTAINSLAHAFGQDGSSANIPSVNVPKLNGIDVVNKTLTDLHLPTFEQISQWGHVFFSGGPLTIGLLILGYSLFRTRACARSSSIFLLAAAGINLISQLLNTLLPVLATVCGIILFASIVWLGISILFPDMISKIHFSVPRQSHRASHK